MEYIVYFDIAAICVLITTLVAYGIRSKIHNLQNTLYRVMLMAVLVMALSDLLIVCCMHAEVLEERNIIYFLKNMYLIGHVCVAVSFAIYSICLTGRLKQGFKNPQHMLFAPVIIIAIFMITQFLTANVYTIDANSVYHRGIGLYVIYACIIYFLMVGWRYLVRYRKKISLENLLSSLAFISVSLIVMFIQWLFPHILIQPFGMSLCILLYLIAMEKPQDYMDPEFKVYNQRAMIKYVSEKLVTRERLPVLIVKVHNLKVMRQTIGADAVNELLVEMADFLRKVEKNINVYHFSQSVFVIAMDRKSNDIEGSVLLRKIRERFNNPWVTGELEMKFAIHITYFVCPRDADNLNLFMDYIQYMRNRTTDNPETVMKLSGMDIEQQKREMQIRRLLSEATENCGFEVFYQPIYSVTDQRVMSAEALVRLKDQSLGYVSPEEFIPVAEKNGMIMKLGEYVFETVCRFLHEEHLKEYGIEYIEINLSVVQCMQDNLAERLTEIMDQYEITPDQINLEITETAAIHSTEVLEHNIITLHDKGINFSLDDYGSGYSNTDYLFRFPFRIVKIDKLILWEAFRNEKAMIALKNTIKMVKELGLEVVVEGVETQENVDYLQSQECDFLQGYYYSKPIPDSRFLDLIKNGKK